VPKKNTNPVFDQKHSALLINASKTLFANIRFASVDNDVKSLAVTSSMANEGKSTVALNLAMAIATSGKNTLIVDTDMRRRSLAHALKVHPAHGIYAAISGSATLNETIVRTHVDHLFFMDSEPNIPSPPDILSSRRFAFMVKSLRGSFDYVIFDTPPVSLFVDAAILGSLLDGTLFVVRQNFAKRTIALKSVQQLRQANARVLGCVTSFAKDDDGDYYYYHYYSSDERDGSEKNIKPKSR
jgi:capsular exopolysaccharide synthesis family protein